MTSPHESAECRSPLSLWPIIAAVDAGVVSRSVNAEPIGFVDASAIFAGRTGWKRTRHFDPSLLFAGDHADLLSDFRKILVVAKNNSDLVFVAVGHADDV